MNNHIAAIIAISLYFVCSVLLLLKLRRVEKLAEQSTLTLLVPGFIAVLAHSFSLHASIMTSAGIHLGFYTALSLVGAFITLFTLVSALRHPVEILGILVMPIAALSIALDISQTTSHVIEASAGLVAHILTSVVAYSILGLATLHAMLLSVQNSYLHRHQPGGVIRLLPPLRTMESLLFETIIIGFICLSVSLASGLIFLENMFAQHLAHKTILSILAWLVFAVLLLGHWRLGWRGRTAIRWTLGGFISLVLAYFGSKFVLEVILT